jgi:sulfur-oxidizing protein SoxA
MTRLNKIILLFCGALLAVPATMTLAGEVKSGYEFIMPATREMQDDDFENPGLITVEQGQQLFNNKQQSAGKSCADCHGEDGANLDTKVIARYPVYSESAAGIVTLQRRISRCRDDNTGSETLSTDHPDLVALETFVRNRAVGEAVNVQTDGPMADLLKAGEKLYKTRYGLIDMACHRRDNDA